MCFSWVFWQVGVARRQLLPARPTSPCKLLCRGCAPLQGRAGDHQQGPLSPPGPASPMVFAQACATLVMPEPVVPGALAEATERVPTPLTFRGLQALGAGGLEAAQRPLDHLLVLDLHHLGGVGLVVLGTRWEDLPCSAACHLRRGVTAQRHPPPAQGSPAPHPPMRNSQYLPALPRARTGSASPSRDFSTSPASFQTPRAGTRDPQNLLRESPASPPLFQRQPMPPGRPLGAGGRAQPAPTHLPRALVSPKPPAAMGTVPPHTANATLQLV